MPICGIVGCSNRLGVTKDVTFYKTPKTRLNQGVDTRILSEERRRSLYCHKNHTFVHLGYMLYMSLSCLMCAHLFKGH